MQGCDIVVVGASAGGVEALSALAQALPADFPAAVFVCLHVQPNAPSVLPKILSRAGKLHAVHPGDGDPIACGTIYVAPPDHHLLVRDGYVRVTRGPKENGHRPAVDPLFRSAAHTYRERVAGVILTGTLDDGTAGASIVKRLGGTVVVQDPADALFSGMPLSAIENAAVDHVLPLHAIAERLTLLARNCPSRGTSAPSHELLADLEEAEKDMEGEGKQERTGTPSIYTCPECHGTLWEVQEGEVVRFRCRTGHAFSPQSLLADQNDALEAALWTGLRALEEKQDLADRLAMRARQRAMHRSVTLYEEQSANAAQHADVLRRILAAKQESEIPDDERKDDC